MKNITWLVVLLALSTFAGCGGSTEEASDAPVAPEITEEETTATPEPAAEPEVAAEPEPEPEPVALTLPAALDGLLVMPDTLVYTKIDVTEKKGKKLYTIEADTRGNPEKIQKQIKKTYDAMGWTMDLDMSTRSNSTTGYTTETFMIFVECTKGNIGSIVKITAGEM